MNGDPRSFNSPLSLESARRLITVAMPAANASALDIGCGRGEMLALWLEAGGSTAHGIDPDAGEAEVARSRLAAFGDRAQIQAVGIAEAQIPATFDLAICIGATHAFGGPGVAWEAALEALKGRVRPGGRLLLGEGYWKKPPEAAYLEATGMSAGDLKSHADNHAVGESLGLRTLYVTAATPCEWDAFEAGSGLAAERRLDAAPDDPDLQALVERRRAWRRAYLRWGRDTFGFGYYLFEVPA